MCVSCQAPISDPKSKFAEWDEKGVCIPCWGAIPLDVRKQVNQYSAFEKKAKEQEKKKQEMMMKSSGLSIGAK
jgi:hypothetical protein